MWKSHGACNPGLGSAGGSSGISLADQNSLGRNTFGTLLAVADSGNSGRNPVYRCSEYYFAGNLFVYVVPSCGLFCTDVDENNAQNS